MVSTRSFNHLFRSSNDKRNTKLTRQRTHTVQVDLNDESSSPFMSQAGEENYYSSSTEIEEETDTMESIDEALPSRMKVNKTKKTISLTQHKDSTGFIKSISCINRSTCLGIESKERSMSPSMNYVDEDDILPY